MFIAHRVVQLACSLLMPSVSIPVHLFESKSLAIISGSAVRRMQIWFSQMWAVVRLCLCLIIDSKGNQRASCSWPWSPSANSNTRNGKKRCQTRRSNSWVSPAPEHRDDDLLVLGQAEVEGCHHTGAWLPEARENRHHSDRRRNAAHGQSRSLPDVE